jgi:hypothetical protein
MQQLRKIATPAGPSFNDTGPAVRRAATALATDAVPNLSAFWCGEDDTACPTRRPTAPGTPVPVVVSGTQINLSWAASTTTWR